VAPARLKPLLAFAASLGIWIALFALPAAPAAAAPTKLDAHAASSCANTNLTPRPDDLGLVRTAVLCLINQEREAHGESALAPNAKLTQAAQGHSEDMASEDYFSHIAPNGQTPLDRMRASGYIYSARVGYEVGENIAWGTLWLASPQSIVNAWMASPGHRANILDAHYRETGVGVSPHPPASLAEGQAGGIYTQDFGTIVTTGNAARHTAAHSKLQRSGKPKAGRGSSRSSRRGDSTKSSRTRHATKHGPAKRTPAHGSSKRRSAKHRSARRSGRITSGARTTERSNKSHGSTRRQVRHRHRVRARHRARYRRTAHRARRAGAHQRSRRRHRHAGGQ
jgi:uncharacterized protein YkwD